MTTTEHSPATAADPYGFFRDISLDLHSNVTTMALTVEGLSKAAPLPDADADLGQIRDELTLVLGRVAAASSDNVIAAGKEKADLLTDYQILFGNLEELQARYLELGSPSDITAARNNAFTKRSELDDLLASYVPSWTDLESDTPIDGAVDRARWAAAAQAV